MRKNELLSTQALVCWSVTVPVVHRPAPSVSFRVHHEQNLSPNYHLDRFFSLQKKLILEPFSHYAVTSCERVAAG